MSISNKDFESILEIFKKNKILATKELSKLVSKVLSSKKTPDEKEETKKEIKEEDAKEEKENTKEQENEENDEKENEEENLNSKKDKDNVDAPKDASKISSSKISENNVKNIFKSISIEIDKLKTQFLKFEKFLYQREQIEEAKAAEAFIEGRAGKKTLQVKNKKDRVNSGFLKLLGFALFALAPLIVGFLRNFDFQKMKTFFEKDLKNSITSGVTNFLNGFGTRFRKIMVEDVIQPIKKYFSNVVEGVWDATIDAIQGALSMFNIEFGKKQNEDQKNVEAEQEPEINVDNELDKQLSISSSQSDFFENVKKFFKDSQSSNKPKEEDCSCEEPQTSSPPQPSSRLAPATEPPFKPPVTQEKTTSSTDSYQTIAGERVVPGQPLSEKQQAVMQIKKEMSGSSASRVAPAGKPKKDASKEKSSSTDTISRAIGGSEAGGSYDLAFGDRISKDGGIINVNDSITAEQFSNGKKLSEMTLEEVFSFQEARDQIKKGTSAVGKYQFIKSTLAGLVKKLNLPMNTLFNSETQEKLQQSLLDENKNILQKKGVPLTPGYLYMAHYIGGGGAIAVYNAAQRGEDITVAQAIVNAGYKDPSANNRELATIKVSEFENILASRMEKHGAPPGTQIAQSGSVPKQIVPSEKISGIQVSKLSEEQIQDEDTVTIIQNNNPALEENAQASYTPPKAGAPPLANRNNSVKKNSIQLYENILGAA